MNLHALFIVLALVVAAPTAHATQSVFPARSCANCTASQMQTMAKNTMPVGITFVYDLPHHAIRKYDVYMDSDCRPVGGLSSSAVRGKGGAGTKTGEGADCGSFKAADEMMPVDPDVQEAFDTLYNSYVHDPSLASNGEILHYGVPLNPHNYPNPFNLQQVAWDYPNASYQDFMREINDIFSDKSSMNQWDPGTGDYLFGYEMASFHVGVVLSVPPGVEGQVSWDRNNMVHVSICTDNAGSPGDCAKFDVAASSGVVQIQFKGIFDKNNDIYPNANGVSPGNLTSWGFPHGGADHFSDILRNHNVYVPNSGYCSPGTHPFLTVTRDVSNHYHFEDWSCQQN